jgi:hypothetical protein
MMDLVEQRGPHPPGPDGRVQPPPRLLTIAQAWVVRTALNLHVSWWRRYRREVAWNDRDLPDGLDVGSVVDGDIAVFAALRTLPVRRREVIALRTRLAPLPEKGQQYDSACPQPWGAPSQPWTWTLR